MQIIDVTAQLEGISFAPGNELEEILQNVRTILTTMKGSVPLDRDFGLDGAILDRPVNALRAVLTTNIIEAVEQYEPRVKVKQVIFAGMADEGIVIPTVRVVIR